jgi:hypothetical protein
VSASPQTRAGPQGRFRNMVKIQQTVPFFTSFPAVLPALVSCAAKTARASEANVAVSPLHGTELPSLSSFATHLSSFAPQRHRLIQILHDG